MLSDELVIELNKMKMLLGLLRCICCVAFGVWLLLTGPQIAYVFGVILILLLGYPGWMIFIKLFDTRPGFIINSEGIADNSGAVPALFVPWSDITGIGEYQSVRQDKYVSIRVKNPEKYVNTGSALNKMAKQAIFEFSGAPIQISAVNLKISYDELLNVIVDFHQKNSRNV